MMQLMPCMFLLIAGVTSLPSAEITKPRCSLKSEDKTSIGEDVVHIKMTCDGDKVLSVVLENGPELSGLEISGADTNEKHTKQYISVKYYKSKNDMIIAIKGEKYDVKDDKEEQETKKLKELFEDPEFSFFHDAVGLIHDELQIKGWESAPAMFLYSLGMAAESTNLELRRRGWDFDFDFNGHGVNLQSFDPETTKYNGPNPTKSCKKNGWFSSDLKKMESSECSGVCGPSCKKCWTWVCGDCCMHTGCKRHDQFCGKSGYMSRDCLSARGVLWDTVTNTPKDC